MGINTRLDTLPDKDIAILRVQGDLDFDMRNDFQVALSDLLQAPPARLVVDLSRISRMSSVFIGTLTDFGSRAAADGKTPSCVLPRRMAQVCRDAGLDKVVAVIEHKGTG